MCLTIVFALCSVLSKEQGITVVAVCVCYDFFIVHKVCTFHSCMALQWNLRIKDTWGPEQMSFTQRCPLFGG